MELEPKFLNQKSFYGKAKVIKLDDSILLQSYNTIVAEIKDGKAKIFGWYSTTTTKHIKEFLAQNGFGLGTKTQLEKLYY